MLLLAFLVQQVLVELFSTVRGYVHGKGVIEFGIVHQIFARVVAVPDQLLKPVAPQNLRWQI